MKYIHSGAVISGEVEVGDGTNIWPGAVVRGDLAKITIGANCSIQDNSVIHAEPGKEVTIGDDVIIAHGAVLHSCSIGSNVLCGIGSIILDECKIGDNVLIAAGTVIKPRTEIKSDSFVYMKDGALQVKGIEDKHLKLMQSTRDNYARLVEKYVAGEI